MVTVVIGKEYLHYANPDLERECQIKGDYKNAYCSFTPQGMNCNVVGWECLDIRNLLFQKKMQPFYMDFYNNAMLQLKKYQQEERKCVEDVRNTVATVDKYVKSFIGVSFWSRDAITCDVQEQTELEENNISKKGVLFEVRVQIFIGVFLGEDICYNNVEEIYLLPPTEIGVVGYIDYNPS